MNAYDIDGVLTAGVVPVPPFIAVTSRPVSRFKETVDWLNKYHPQYLALYIRPTFPDNDARAGAIWKATIIQQSGAKSFHEDCPFQYGVIVAELAKNGITDCVVHKI